MHSISGKPLLTVSKLLALTYVQLPLTDKTNTHDMPNQSQAIKTPNMIYCSGQIPLTPEGEMVQGITEQTRQACKNVQAVVEAAGSSISKVVKTTVFISDMSYFAVGASARPIFHSVTDSF